MSSAMRDIVENSFKMNLAGMKIFGYYSSEKYPRLYRFCAYAFYLLFVTPGSLLGFTQLFMEKGANGGKQDQIITTAMIFLSPKYLFLVINGENIKQCIHYFDKEIFAIQNQGHGNIIEDCVRICQRNSRVFISGCFISVFGWCGKIVFNSGNYQLPLNVWTPFELEENPTFYYFLYLNILIGALYIGISCAIVDPFITGLICHASGQLQVLKGNLQQLDKCLNRSYHNEKKKSNDIYNNIKKCVIHYKAIVDFVNQCENSFSWSLFCQFMESIILIGFCCLEISKMQDFNFNSFLLVDYFLVILIQVYFYCYYGATLIEENDSLSVAIYMSDWYNYDRESKQALSILIERSKRPLIITAGKVVELSLETFMSIIKKSYSLLAVLKN